MNLGEHSIEIISTVVTAAVGAFGWFSKKLIKDMEEKVSSAQKEVMISQDAVRKEMDLKITDLYKVVTEFKDSSKELQNNVRVMEKNVVELSFTTKNIDQNTKEKLESLNKTADQMNIILQRIIVAEEKIAQFGKVILKN